MAKRRKEALSELLQRLRAEEAELERRRNIVRADREVTNARYELDAWEKVAAAEEEEELAKCRNTQVYAVPLSCLQATRISSKTESKMEPGSVIQLAAKERCLEETYRPHQHPSQSPRIPPPSVSPSTVPFSTDTGKQGSPPSRSRIAASFPQVKGHIERAPGESPNGSSKSSDTPVTTPPQSLQHEGQQQDHRNQFNEPPQVQQQQEAVLLLEVNPAQLLRGTNNVATMCEGCGRISGGVRASRSEENYSASSLPDESVQIAEKARRGSVGGQHQRPAFSDRSESSTQDHLVDHAHQREADTLSRSEDSYDPRRLSLEEDDEPINGQPANEERLKLKYTYKEGHWSPSNPDGENDLDFLLQFQNECSYRADGSPSTLEILLERAAVITLCIEHDGGRNPVSLVLSAGDEAPQTQNALSGSLQRPQEVPYFSVKPSTLANAGNQQLNDLNRQAGAYIASLPGMAPSQSLHSTVPASQLHGIHSTLNIKPPPSNLPFQQPVPQPMYQVPIMRPQNPHLGLHMQGMQTLHQAGAPKAQQGANTGHLMQTNATASGPYVQPGVTMSPMPIVNQFSQHMQFQHPYTPVFQPSMSQYYSSAPQQGLMPAAQPGHIFPLATAAPVTQKKKKISSAIEPAMDQRMTELIALRRNVLKTNSSRKAPSSGNATPPIMPTTTQPSSTPEVPTTIGEPEGKPLEESNPTTTQPEHEPLPSDNKTAAEKSNVAERKSEELVSEKKPAQVVQETTPAKLDKEEKVDRNEGDMKASEADIVESENTEGQWTSDNPDEKKRGFLLQTEDDCTDKSEELPNIPDIVLDKVFYGEQRNQQENQLSTAQNREDEQIPDAHQRGKVVKKTTPAKHGHDDKLHYDEMDDGMDHAAITQEPKMKRTDSNPDHEHKKYKLKYTYKEGQWSPNNQDGRKQYDRDFLLQFPNDCTDKPEGLPHIPEIILDKADLRRLWSLTTGINQKGSDLMPAFMKSPRVKSNEDSAIIAFKLELISLLELKTENHEVIDWIEAYTTSIPKTGAAFIRALVIAICHSVTQVPRNTSKLCTRRLRKRCEVLRHYINMDSRKEHDLELQVLYALQAYIHSLHNPPGRLTSIFNVLFTEGVVSVGVFYEWRESDDPREVEFRSGARKAAEAFFEELDTSGI